MDTLDEKRLNTDERLRMVRCQLVPRGITDGRVLAAMLDVDRARFVPPSQRGAAWSDGPLPLGAGQTISQPYIVARMLQLLALRGGERALEVGTGTGYQAALLGQLARAVVTVERLPELARAARENLRAVGASNVTVRDGDGSAGAPDAGPFDAIVVAAAGPAVPDALVAQLAPGGRLVMPVGTRERQELVRVSRLASGGTTREAFDPVVFVPLIGAEGFRR